MLRRRRVPVAATTALVSGALALSACSGGAGAADDSSTKSTPANTSSSTAPSSPSADSTSPGGSGSSGTPDSSSTTPDPYEIDCTLVPQKTVDTWVRGGQAASIEPTEQGCRVVSSSEAGAVIVEWRWLDVVGSGGDAGILREQETAGDPVTVAPGISGTRIETDVAPTRKARVAAKINGRMLYVESTVTLDRRQTLTDMRRATTQIVRAYEDTTPNPHAEA